jgi:hypothetical protein
MHVVGDRKPYYRPSMASPLSTRFASSVNVRCMLAYCLVSFLAVQFLSMLALYQLLPSCHLSKHISDPEEKWALATTKHRGAFHAFIPSAKHWKPTALVWSLSRFAWPSRTSFSSRSLPIAPEPDIDLRRARRATRGSTYAELPDVFLRPETILDRSLYIKSLKLPQWSSRLETLELVAVEPTSSFPHLLVLSWPPSWCSTAFTGGYR